jgi:SAM-dependent methyltransferase
MLTNILKTIWKSRRAEPVAPAIAGEFPELRCYRACLPLLEGRVGLEIGGPSLAFSRSCGMFPVYSAAERIDNVTFSANTVWRSNVAEGAAYVVDENCAPGRQHVAEATALEAIASATYEFVLSSHTLEHVANPLRALAEWMRVLAEKGLLVLVLPHRDGTFDRHRPVTTLEHLIQDFRQQTTEADLTHLDEILKLHDLSLDPLAGGAEAFRQRSLRNLENRCLHHHVFDLRLAMELVDHAGLQIHAVEAALPFHIFIVAQKISDKARNDSFTGPGAVCLRDSPFSS